MTLHDMGDWQLLEAYAKGRSEAAFAQLVKLHLDWVYSVALRHVGDPHLAEDVVQAVFMLLARKAGDLKPGTLLGGWLFRTTCHVAAHARRGEQRRKIREATACVMNLDDSSPDGGHMLWQQLAPHLDQAVAALPESERSAVLLRFYEKLPFREVGERLEITDEAAKKRVGRALEKMRTFLDRRGVKLSGVVLAAVLAEKTVQAASAALAGVVVGLSLAAAATPAAALSPLARETLHAWHRAKVRMTAGFAAGSLALIFVAAGHFLPGANARQRQSAAGNVQIETTPGRSGTTAPSSRNQTARPETPPKTGAIVGLVLDNQGQPVAGAKVWEGYNSQPRAQDTTDESGRFALDKLGGPAFVTVTADGFGADQLQLDASNTPGPLTFRLVPVRPLMVRLLDESGSGVPGAHLFLQQWWGREETLGDYLPQQTDADGRLVWLSPPRGGLELSFGKPGFRESRTNKFEADGQEHTIVLHPTATVTGRVTDADNGAAVASFKFTMGHSQPWMPDDPVPMWDLKGRAGSNGVYRIVIEEESVPFLRIEAEGYETMEARLELTNELEDVCNLQLKPKSADHAIRGVVLLPDGSPAAGVEVALCTPKVGVWLVGTAFAPDAFGNSAQLNGADYRRKSDAQGAFSFDPIPGAHAVVAAGTAGIGQTRCFDFSQPLVIRLEPWARVEGTVRTRNGKWADRGLKWLPLGSLTSWDTLNYDSDKSSVHSDAAGQFTFEHVPPGDGRVELENGPGAAPVLSTAIHAQPGGTAQVQIGGMGRTITGRLVAPPRLEIRSWTNQVTLARLQNEGESYPLPRDLTKAAEERWKLEYADSEAGRAWLSRHDIYDFKVTADGSFTLPEVLPGKYWLFVNISQGALGTGPDTTPRWTGRDPQIGYAGMVLTVPDGPTDNAPPLNLGDIPVVATH